MMFFLFFFFARTEDSNYDDLIASLGLEQLPVKGIAQLTCAEK